MLGEWLWALTVFTFWIFTPLFAVLLLLVLALLAACVVACLCAAVNDGANTQHGSLDSE